MFKVINFIFDVLDIIAAFFHVIVWYGIKHLFGHKYDETCPYCTLNNL